jgi:hypothetical protein
MCHLFSDIQAFAAILSRSPSSDGVAVLLDTMSRLVSAPVAAQSGVDGGKKALLNAYTAEGHLRLVEVLLVPLSAEAVMSLWSSLDAVSFDGFDARRCRVQIYM